MRNTVYSQAVNFFIYIVLQLIVLHRFILFETAFCFFYVGFLLFLPLRQNRVFSLAVAFFIGLFVDIFSDTLGMHASASLLVMYWRTWWFTVTNGAPEEDIQINALSIGTRGMILFAVPLIFVHHLLLFILEHGSLTPLGLVGKRVILSTLLTSVVVITVSFLLAPRVRRI